MYGARGWSGVCSSSSNTSHHPGLVPVQITSEQSVFNDDIFEEDDMDDTEDSDLAGPLPSDRRLTADAPEDSYQRPRSNAAQKSVVAKDKRRLREKRRSTGVAKLIGHQADEETVQNTSYNEIAAATGVKSTPSTNWNKQPTSVPAQRIYAPSQNKIREEGEEEEEKKKGGVMTSSAGGRPSQATNANNSLTNPPHSSHPDDLAFTQHSMEALRIQRSKDGAKVTEVTSSTSVSSVPDGHVAHKQPQPSSDHARTFCARPVEAKETTKRGILKTSRSVPGVKPEKPEKPASISAAVGTQSVQRPDEEQRLLKRVAELEKLLENQVRENAILNRLLSDRDLKIRNLEVEIDQLNEDLVLADEENVALTRALSKSVSD